jgi:WD40 repeat protein
MAFETEAKIKGFKNNGDEILTIMFDEARGNILIGGNNCHINIWSIRTQEHMGTFVGHEDSVSCLTLDENLLFSGGDDNLIFFWNLEANYNTLERQHVGVLRGHTDSVQCLLLLKETGILLSCSFDKHVIAWKYQHMQAIWKVKKREELRCMDYIATSKILLVGTNCHEKTDHDEELMAKH